MVAPGEDSVVVIHSGRRLRGAAEGNRRLNTIRAIVFGLEVDHVLDRVSLIVDDSALGLGARARSTSGRQSTTRAARSPSTPAHAGSWPAVDRYYDRDERCHRHGHLVGRIRVRGQPARCNARPERSTNWLDWQYAPQQDHRCDRGRLRRFVRCVPGDRLFDPLGITPVGPAPRVRRPAAGATGSPTPRPWQARIAVPPRRRLGGSRFLSSGWVDFVRTPRRPARTEAVLARR